MNTKPEEETGLEIPVRFKLSNAIKSDYTIQNLFGRYAVLKRAADGLYDGVSWHSSQRKAEAALVVIVTKG